MAGTAHAVPAFIVRLSKFWPRAVWRAANLMMLTPSTGRILESETLPLKRMEGRVVASAREPARRAARRCRSCLGVTAILAPADRRPHQYQRGVDRGRCIDHP